MCHTSTVPSTTALVCEPFVPFFNADSEEPQWYVILSIAVVQPRLYLSTFYRGCTTALVSLIQPRLNVFFSTSDLDVNIFVLPFTTMVKLHV